MYNRKPNYKNIDNRIIDSYIYKNIETYKKSRYNIKIDDF